ncbi:hypothetical protein SRABI84_00643 [Peribacillus simplex]|nr:hypothetical protein SRABI84_00643 [Peribacillus simplex]
MKKSNKSKSMFGNQDLDISTNLGIYLRFRHFICGFSDYISDFDFLSAGFRIISPISTFYLRVFGIYLRFPHFICEFRNISPFPAFYLRFSNYICGSGILSAFSEFYLRFSTFYLRFSEYISDFDILSAVFGIYLRFRHFICEFRNISPIPQKKAVPQGTAFSVSYLLFIKPTCWLDIQVVIDLLHFRISFVTESSQFASISALFEPSPRSFVISRMI